MYPGKGAVNTPSPTPPRKRAANDWVYFVVRLSVSEPVSVRQVPLVSLQKRPPQWLAVGVLFVKP